MPRATQEFSPAPPRPPSGATLAGNRKAFYTYYPGSTLIGFLNADHWAIAVPVSRSHPVISRSLVNRNDYPREALLEAVLRFIEEDLSGAAPPLGTGTAHGPSR